MNNSAKPLKGFLIFMVFIAFVVWVVDLNRNNPEEQSQTQTEGQQTIQPQRNNDFYDVNDEMKQYKYCSIYKDKSGYVVILKETAKNLEIDGSMLFAKVEISDDEENIVIQKKNGEQRGYNFKNKTIEIINKN